MKGLVEAAGGLPACYNLAPGMDTHLAALLQLQDLEQRHRELQNQITALPQRITHLEKELQPARDRRQAAAQGLESQQSERRQIEAQVLELKQKIEKSRTHSAEVKTNQEYRAVKDEIDWAEREIRQREDRLLALMEQAEKLEAERADADKLLDEQEAGLAGRREEMTAAGAAWQGEQRELDQEIHALRAQVDDHLLHRYDRIAKLRGKALSAIVKETCSCCRVRLRPQFLQEISNHPERRFFCEYCGRILYQERVEVPPFTGDIQVAG